MKTIDIIPDDYNVFNNLREMFQMYNWNIIEDFNISCKQSDTLFMIGSDYIRLIKPLLNSGKYNTIILFVTQLDYHNHLKDELLDKNFFILSKLIEYKDMKNNIGLILEYIK